MQKKEKKYVQRNDIKKAKTHAPWVHRKQIKRTSKKPRKYVYIHAFRGGNKDKKKKKKDVYDFSYSHFRGKR